MSTGFSKIGYTNERKLWSIDQLLKIPRNDTPATNDYEASLLVLFLTRQEMEWTLLNVQI